MAVKKVRAVYTARGVKRSTGVSLSLVKRAVLAKRRGSQLAAEVKLIDDAIHEIVKDGMHRKGSVSGYNMFYTVHKEAFKHETCRSQDRCEGHSEKLRNAGLKLAKVAGEAWQRISQQRRALYSEKVKELKKVYLSTKAD
eukprot:TRINITY_DN31386_c0_g1_i1.p2 TRINITY_DN31386_c0_g1~~TRINITY_DN31386_c0_g1_i1.p2  ORF type:complete len:140 (-),score=35.95 TRINITY_DN31386_c0_g1_i1:56-475(-)